MKEVVQFSHLILISPFSTPFPFPTAFPTPQVCFTFSFQITAVIVCGIAPFLKPRLAGPQVGSGMRCGT